MAEMEKFGLFTADLHYIKMTQDLSELLNFSVSFGIDRVMTRSIDSNDSSSHFFLPDAMIYWVVRTSNLGL